MPIFDAMLKARPLRSTAEETANKRIATAIGVYDITYSDGRSSQLESLAALLLGHERRPRAISNHGRTARSEQFREVLCHMQCLLAIAVLQLPAIQYGQRMQFFNVTKHKATSRKQRRHVRRYLR